MRLFLSSYGIGNQQDKLVSLLHDNKKVAVVTNAADYHDEAGIIERLEKDKLMFHSLGMSVERLDLRDYFGNNSNLKEKLLEYGLVWVRGGNAFVLRRAMRQSAFDEVITSLLTEDKIVYGGYSAGACVLSPTLRGVELCDDPNVIPDGYEKEIIWDGLGLVNFSLAPHYQSDHPESEMIDRVVEYYSHNRMQYRVLHDGEVIILQGEKEDLIS